MIPNSSDLDLFRPDLDGTDWRKRLGLKDRFAAVYFGAMGLANGLDYVVEAARILAERHSNNIVIVLHGDGGKRPQLEQMVRDYVLENVVFSDLVPDKKEVARLVAACDVSLTIYAAAKEQTWSPNKMFDGLAVGKPVLINVPGWLGGMVEENKCGRLLDPHKPETLADTLQELAAKPQLCQEMGAKARDLAKREFARDKLADRFEAVLLEAEKTYSPNKRKK